MKKYLSAIFLVLTLSSCSTNKISEHSILMGDTSDITINDMRSSISNGLLLAQANFYNAKSSAVTGYYRCIFFDANKMTIGDPQIWQAVTIYPNETQSIKCAATDVEATSFKVEFSGDAKTVSVFK
jgi:uncharacterized protein YcfL